MLRAAGSTDVGLRRRENEDAFALAPELGLCVVADGMGGHTAGQVASQLAAEAVHQAIQMLENGPATPSEKLRYAVSAANRAVHGTARQRSECAGMGTTLVALLFEGQRAALAHVGDSRAYLLRGDRVRQLTDDHSIVGEFLRRREISEDAAREHPHRHVLTRARSQRHRRLPHEVVRTSNLCSGSGGPLPGGARPGLLGGKLPSRVESLFLEAIS